MDRLFPDFDVHGGVTYSGNGAFIDAAPDGLYWIGIDFAHYGDYVVGLAERGYEDDNARRWDEMSIAAEIERLADQIEAMACH